MLEQALLPTGARNGAGSTEMALSFEGDRGQAEWDAFVASADDGHHAQSSTWADVKGVLGWRGTRVVVREGGEIVGGAQVLVRDVGPFGRVGTSAHGPLLARRDPRLVDLIHDGLLELARGERIRYLKVQPPVDSVHLAPELRDRGWTPSALSAAPSATVRVDLRASEDEILARMQASTRKKIRQAERRGLRLREGGSDDFPAYHRVIEATSQRHGFMPYPARYYEMLWEAFAECEGTCLMLAELDGTVLSATLAIAFNHGATTKMGGWSGERSRVRPNEAMHFAAMRWAKRIGARYYDFDGIDRETAIAALSEGELPEDAQSSGAGFKLGFGGDVVLFPETLDIGPGRLLRPLVRLSAPHLTRIRPLAHRVAGRG
jgi:lipid II:glycine glycyltransferase (peptidoglycan interpeptide bridge formation enzyme)